MKPQTQITFEPFSDWLAEAPVALRYLMGLFFAAVAGYYLPMFVVILTTGRWRNCGL